MLVNEQKERLEVLKMCRSFAWGKNDIEMEVTIPDSAVDHTTTGFASLKDEKTGDEVAHKMEAGGSEFSQHLNGAVSAMKQPLFERMVFRVSKGNAILNFKEITDPITDPASGELVQKVAFRILAVKGEQMQRRLRKICTFFGANIYDIPASDGGCEREMTVAQQKLTEHLELANTTKAAVVGVLKGMALSSTTTSPLVDWLHALKKEQLVAEIMRQTTSLAGSELGRQHVMVAVGWVPTSQFFNFKSLVERINSGLSSQQVVLSEEHAPRSPPTYFETNKFTSAFQAIVDTYGMPRYQEVNPGLFTIVTFPFLFGVMYGDVLHGSCLFLFALYMVYNEEKLLESKRIGQMGEMFGMAFGGRYVLILMALFGIYAGTLYNDAASIPMNIFGTRWNLTEDEENPNWHPVMFPERDHYPWGVDPEWYGKKNELVFLNSLKMKLAIVLGVTQMCFGICLGLFNNLYFKDYAGILFEFIPRITFMVCTFGYMAILIIFKWCTDWSDYPSPGAPNLVQTMIGMFLRPGSVAESQKLYEGQAGLQVFMLLIALACVPAMLFGQPCLAKREFKKKYGTAKIPRSVRLGTLDASNDTDAIMEEKHAEPAHAEEDHGDGHSVGPNWTFSDAVITQSIHTIEFVLGAVSNTASYLRLWALSLAHAQLAQVFWSKMMMDYGISNSPVFAFVGFACWAGATIAVLLCMDVLECFLHALRLHWVEFQNKFFHADGYAFEPFSFDNMDEAK
jgi:V-type H+-transporting ATPase subunit a